MDDRKAMSAIFYVLRTGCQWNALPRSLGASSTVDMTDSRNGERLVFSSECGSMDCRYMIKNWDRLEMAGYGWRDYKSTSWGKKAQDQIPRTELNQVQKRSILVDGKGVPLGVSVDGANRHDMKMTKATLQSIVIYL